ncbi:hypothetical protein [Campylobacter troglodytis]|uniref:hypothetical protein n=1 Tax=Campylobacter troglodytis TaxID=654363 RepID=UPI00115C20F5|nr:hypothetical protein [Campylobacter troglodytis]TQR54198.1 hypothetical protein DMC01_10490 [Campylobacter troglodytis]
MNDRSLDNINLTKLLVYAFCLLCLCAILIVFLIIPVLRDYKRATAQLEHQRNINLDLSQKFQAAENRLNDLQFTNKDILSRLHSDFNASDFLSFLDTYFKDANLTLLPTQKDLKYLHQDLNITGVIEKPANFYDFVDALQKYKNIIKLELPMNLQSRSDGLIDIDFAVKIYSSKMEEPKSDP